jgi:hypothetical protein
MRPAEQAGRVRVSGPIRGTAAPGYKNALYAAAQQLYAGSPDTAQVLVSFGQPGTFEPDEIVKIGMITTDQSPATISTNRAREETLTLEVTVSVHRGGGPDQEQVASDRAYALLQLLADYVHHTDTTLGGAVRMCFLTSTESDGATDPDLIAQGRMIAIVAKFTAAARITN